MYTEELFVHDGGQRQGTEGLHACFIDLLRVFVLALEFEGEIIRQMPAFMVPSQQPQGVGIPYLQ